MGRMSCAETATSLPIPFGAPQEAVRRRPLLRAYLSEHLGGSEAALMLLERMVARYGHTPRGSFFRGLRTEVREDQRVMAELCERLDGPVAPRRATRRFSDPRPPAGTGALSEQEEFFALLEALEMLSVGVTGKRFLWQTLAAVAAIDPLLADVDFDELERRAARQQSRLEDERLDVAPHALRARP
jgi:hypothetical protein